MRPVIWCVAVLVAVLGSRAIHAAANDGPLSLSDLVREVKVALLQVNEAAESQNLPKLDTAVLEAKTSMKYGVDGKINLWVVEAGGGKSNEYASTVTLTLKPPPPGSPSNIASISLAPALKEAILSGARAIYEAGQGNPKLLADKLEASVHFTVASSRSNSRRSRSPAEEISRAPRFKRLL
jgi:hypothetical protein